MSITVRVPIPSAPKYEDLSHNQEQPEGQLYNDLSRDQEQPGFAPQAYYIEPIDEKKELAPATPTTIYTNNTPTRINSNIKQTNEIVLFEPEGMVKSTPLASYHPISKKKKKNINAYLNLICVSMHDSLGLFKNKANRIKIFQKVVLNTTKAERITIRNYYRKKYNETLNSTIQENFKGALRELLLFAFRTNNELIINNIQHALKRKHINTLSSILCVLDNCTLSTVHKTFNKAFSDEGKTLKQSVDKITTNLFHQRNIGKYLLKILDGKRRNDGNINLKTVEKDVDILYKHLKQATIQNLNKELLINMFVNRSYQHLYHVSLKYEQKYNKSLYGEIRRVFKNTSETGYAILLTLNYSVNKYKVYCNEFAKYIHACTKKRSNYTGFLRFVMLHYDYDLKNIIDFYGRQALKSWIQLEFKNNEICNIVLKLCGLY